MLEDIRYGREENGDGQASERYVSRTMRRPCAGLRNSPLIDLRVIGTTVDQEPLSRSVVVPVDVDGIEWGYQVIAVSTS